MDAKKYLSQAYYLDQRIDAKIEQAERLRGLAEKITVNFSDMPKVGQSQQQMEDAVCKLVDLQKEIIEDASALIDLKRETIAAIKAVPGDEQKLILELRYLCGLKWNAIARKRGYSVRNVFFLHEEALKNIKA